MVLKLRCNCVVVTVCVRCVKSNKRTYLSVAQLNISWYCASLIAAARCSSRLISTFCLFQKRISLVRLWQTATSATTLTSTCLTSKCDPLTLLVEAVGRRSSNRHVWFSLTAPQSPLPTTRLSAESTRLYSPCQALTRCLPQTMATTDEWTYQWSVKNYYFFFNSGILYFYLKCYARRQQKHLNTINRIYNTRN